VELTAIDAVTSTSSTSTRKRSGRPAGKRSARSRVDRGQLHGQLDHLGHRHQTGVNLPVGVHVLRVFFTGAGMNLNSMTFQ